MDLSLGLAPALAPSRPASAVRGTGAADLALGSAARDAAGPPPPGASSTDGNIRVRGAQVGKDWIAQLHEWWLQHSYYPRQAARDGEDGTVVVHVKVNRDGKVEMVDIESRSGSQWLDAGAQAVFRGATLPPFPPTTPENEADLDITIDYILVRR